MNPPNESPTDFVRSIVAADLRDGKNDGRVHTRFPPEPNGYLHIGHAKSICLNFGIAGEFGGLCNLRYDDTNPSKEELEYVESIKEDVAWLGFDWEDREYYASDYFEAMYKYAEKLIELGMAFVCDLSQDEIREFRGTLTEPGKESPWRNRGVEENLDLFRRMRAGEFGDGSKVLRAKIDMASDNIHLRDPIIYRIQRATHHRTGDEWCVYPMYDFAHGLEDMIEGITHSVCTLEFEVHRPLYDWFLDVLETPCHPQQIEFARLNLNYTVMSKRKLLELVKGGYVSGWDDPRMPTISGLRRRGYSPEAIREFCKTIGVTKYNSVTDISLLEHCLRDDLNRRSLRVMAVLDPVKLVIDNYPVDKVEMMEAVNNPENPADGSRLVPFSRELYIERSDFMEEPPRKFFRMAPGREVRLRYGYLVTCTGVERAANGEPSVIHCQYDPATRGGSAPDGRKVKGTIHWVAAASAIDAEVRIYDRLFDIEDPGDGGYLEHLNPESLMTLAGCKLEPSLATAKAGEYYQFERLGYFCVDSRDSTAANPVFNRTVALRDSWAKKNK